MDTTFIPGNTSTKRNMDTPFITGSTSIRKNMDTPFSIPDILKAGIIIDASIY